LPPLLLPTSTSATYTESGLLLRARAQGFWGGRASSGRGSGGTPTKKQLVGDGQRTPACWCEA